MLLNKEAHLQVLPLVVKKYALNNDKSKVPRGSKLIEAIANELGVMLLRHNYGDNYVAASASTPAPAPAPAVANNIPSPSTRGASVAKARPATAAEIAAAARGDMPRRQAVASMAGASQPQDQPQDQGKFNNGEEVIVYGIQNETFSALNGSPGALITFNKDGMHPGRWEVHVPITDVRL